MQIGGLDTLLQDILKALQEVDRLAVVRTGCALASVVIQLVILIHLFGGPY